MATLGDIERLVKDYAHARDHLGETLISLEEKKQALSKQYLPGIKAQVRIAKGAHARLQAAVEESRHLFVKPKTIIIFGVKVGIKKQKGKIKWANEDAVIRLIEKHFPEQVDLLVKTTKKPIKKALQSLTVADLKKLGITVAETSDAVVIEPVDSEVAKLVDALLEEKPAPEDEEEAA